MKMKFIQNKKADVPVMILVLGVVAICALAIVSFIGVELEATRDPLGVELVEEIYSDVEKFYFYKNLEFTNQESVDMVNQDVTHIVSEEDKLILDGNQLIIERRIIERSNDVVSVKYIKNLE